MTDTDVDRRTLPPADDTAHLLVLALSLGERFTVEAGELHVTLPDGSGRVPQRYLDELEARGWVALTGEDSAAVTESGQWHLQKWMRRKLGPGVVVTSARVRRAA